MNNDLLLNGGGIPSIGKPKIDPRDYETIKCSHCGGIIFEEKYVLKKVSGVELGQGARDMMIPLNVLVCSQCHNIMDSDIKGYKLEKDLGLENNSK